MKRQLVGLIVLLTFFAGLITIICVNSKYIFRSEPYYSETEVEQMCKNSYDKAVEENSDEALIDTIAKVNELYYKLEAENEQLLSENASLKSDISSKEKTISENKATIETLNTRIVELEENKFENETLISELQVQVSELDKQNKLLEYEISQNEEVISENNKIITQLQNSIAYYEEFINGLENDSEVFAIFVIENEIFNIQKLNKNGLAYLETEPTFEDGVTFNGWAVNGEVIDLTTYQVGCNTTFVADLTYSYSVNFIVDDEVYDAQTIIKNEYASVPEKPAKDGYIFDGWSLNKVNLIENIETIPVVQTTIYYAMFTKSYTVNFIVDDEVYDTQTIIQNEYASVPEIPAKDGYSFIGWTSNNGTSIGDIVENINNTIIESDINYYALFVEDYEGRYDVLIYGGIEIGYVQVVNLDFEIHLYYGWALTNYSVSLTINESTYTWTIKNTRVTNSNVYFAVSGSTRYGQVSAKLNTSHEIVYTITLREENATIRSSTIFEATQRTQYIHFLVADAETSYDTFTESFPSTGFETSISLGFTPTSANDTYLAELPTDIELTDGYIIEWYYSETNPSSIPQGIDYNSLTLIGSTDNPSSFEFAPNDNRMIYVVARYVKQ